MSGTEKPRWQKDGTLSHVGRPDWLLNGDMQSLMTAFERGGFQIFAVGGCVRDTVLNRVVKDVDLSTDARPEQTKEIIENLPSRGTPWKAIPTGIEHGTITAVGPTGTYEITTFRTDLDTDGRHANVAFSDHIEDDAERRDFTINAFYADRHGSVHDLVGGSSDLQAKRVRFIGNPEARIEEDYLRILRFFRFTASHGNRDEGIDAEGLAACAALADGLERISRERIGLEMTRLIRENDVAPIIGMMEQSGVLSRILPGAGVLTLARLIDLEDHYPIHEPDQSSVDMATRIASLGCANAAERLRLKNREADKIKLVLREAGASTSPHELGYRHGYLPAIHCLLLRWASLQAPFDRTALRKVKAGADAVFPISASDLMPAYSGKALGDQLKQLENRWIESDFSFSKAALLESI